MFLSILFLLLKLESANKLEADNIPDVNIIFPDVSPISPERIKNPPNKAVVIIEITKVQNKHFLKL